MEKKAQARSAMLSELKKEMSNDEYSPLKDLLSNKGMKKVSVMSDSPKGLEKGLSMAEKLMKLKSKQSDDSEMEDESSCEMCKGKGCRACESEESESPEMMAADEISEMSEDEMIAMYELLKEKLGKA
jgi:hypothetical protein